MTLSGGETTVAHGPARRADAVIAGDERAWIRALCPDHDRRDLKITGNARLAESLLDALSSNGTNGAEHQARAAA